MRYTKRHYGIPITINNRVILMKGTSGWSYPSTVGCGENVTILHYTVNSDQCNDGEVVPYRCCSEFRGYQPTSLAYAYFGEIHLSRRNLQFILESQIAAINEVDRQPIQCLIRYNSEVLAEGLIKLEALQSLRRVIRPRYG